MPISYLLKDAAFGPEEVVAISTAFEGACETLGLTDRNDPFVQTIAKAIFRAAEYDAARAEQIQQRALIVLQLLDKARGNLRLHDCPICGTAMRLFGVEDDKPGFELHSFDCAACHHIGTEVAKSISLDRRDSQ